MKRIFNEHTTVGGFNAEKAASSLIANLIYRAADELFDAEQQIVYNYKLDDKEANELELKISNIRKELIDLWHYTNSNFRNIEDK